MPVDGGSSLMGGGTISAGIEARAQCRALGSRRVRAMMRSDTMEAAMKVEKRLEELKITLPAVTPPLANYVPCRR